MLTHFGFSEYYKKRDSSIVWLILLLKKHVLLSSANTPPPMCAKNDDRPVEINTPVCLLLSFTYWGCWTTELNGVCASIQHQRCFIGNIFTFSLHSCRKQTDKLKTCWEMADTWWGTEWALVMKSVICSTTWQQVRKIYICFWRACKCHTSSVICIKAYSISDFWSLNIKIWEPSKKNIHKKIYLYKSQFT